MWTEAAALVASGRRPKGGQEISIIHVGARLSELGPLAGVQPQRPGFAWGAASQLASERELISSRPGAACWCLTTGQLAQRTNYEREEWEARGEGPAKRQVVELEAK